MRYLAKTKTQTITSNTILPPEDFGGWSVLNTGDTTVIINDIPTSQSGAIVGVDFTSMHPSAIYGEDIVIRFLNDGVAPSAVVTRIKYTEML